MPGQTRDGPLRFRGRPHLPAGVAEKTREGGGCATTPPVLGVDEGGVPPGTGPGSLPMSPPPQRRDTMTDQPDQYLTRHCFQDLLDWWTKTREVLAADSAPDVTGTVPQPTAEQLRSWQRGEVVEEEDDDTLTRILDWLLLCDLAEFEHSLLVDGDALFAEELRAIVHEVADEIIDRG